MTYYAVTNDPNELAHFGILGMKWGIRRSPEQLGHPRHRGSGRRRSTAYKNAQSKLGKMMKSGIKKAEANWRAYNSPQAKEKRFMDKAMQQARNGTLKYGKLTDAQVRRITDRLALERQARQLGSTEQPRYAKRIKMAIGEGIVRGIGMGTASYIDARFKGRGETTAAIKKDKRMTRYEGKERTQNIRARNKQTEEFYKTAYEEGNNPEHISYSSAKSRAKYLEEVKNRNKATEIQRQNRESFNKAYYTNMGKNMAEWQKNNPSPEPIGTNWSESRRTPRLTSGTSYPVTSSTYQPPKSNTNTIMVVDSNGRVRRKRHSRRNH